MKPETTGDFDCARGFSGPISKLSDNPKINVVAHWSIARGYYFLKQLEAAADPYNVEGQLYILKRIFEKAFNDVHHENAFGDRP